MTQQRPDPTNQAHLTNLLCYNFATTLTWQIVSDGKKMMDPAGHSLSHRIVAENIVVKIMVLE